MSTAVLQPDGKLLVAGNVNATLGDVFIARFNPNGALDTTFGGGTGYVTTNARPGEMDEANAIALQPDGMIVVGGGAGGPGKSDFLVARYYPDGSPDYSFGSGGYVTTDASGIGDTIYSIAIQPDGKIVATGTGASNLVTARYNADGSLDTSFAQAGIATVDYFGYTDFASDVAIDKDGKIVVVGGSIPVGGQRQWVLLRYNPDG